MWRPTRTTCSSVMARVSANSTSAVLRRGLAFKKEPSAAPKRAGKKKVETQRDPYEGIKLALGADQTAQKVAELQRETDDERRERQARLSREAHLETNNIHAHLTRLIRMREAATKALPPELQTAAREVLLTPIPIDRRIFTETAPIKDFQAKISAREREAV